MQLIPQPKELILNSGTFKLHHDTEIILHADCDSSDLDSAFLIKKELLELTGLELSISKTFDIETVNCIIIRRCKMEPQSYTLGITPIKVELSAGDSDGIFYGVQTLRQLLMNSSDEIQCMVINDSPSFFNRGFYHDVTRGKVPKLETLKLLADKASFYKINQLQLYVEHTFAFKDMSEVWRNSDPLTADEILEFDQYCAKKHIELVPSLATFGHLYHLLTSKNYIELCELDVDSNRPFSWYDRMAHHTLDVSNPDSLIVIQKMLSEFIPLFSSKHFNICCDETFDLGEGKNKEKAGKIGKTQLYLDFLTKVISYVEAHDKKVMCWGDIILKEPQCLKSIPKGVICLNWDYSPEPNEENVKKLSESGIEQYVCPGVWGWNRIMNNIHTACSNIKNMIHYGKKYGASGVLNTDWGDYGHINLFGNSMPGMIFGASLSWNSSSISDEELNSKISRIEYGDSSGRLVDHLAALSDQTLIDWRQLVQWYYNRSYGFPAEDEINAIESLSPDAIINSYNKSEEIKTRLMEALGNTSPKAALSINEHIISARGLKLILALLMIIKKYDLEQNIDPLIFEPGELSSQLEYWFHDYAKIWRIRNKESELFRIKEVIFKICDILRDYGNQK